MASFPQHLGEPGLAGVLNHGNLQSIDAEQFAEEEAVKAADVKLQIEMRRHHLGIANAIAEKLCIPVCADCGRRLVK